MLLLLALLLIFPTTTLCSLLLSAFRHYTMHQTRRARQRRARALCEPTTSPPRRSCGTTRPLASTRSLVRVSLSLSLSCSLHSRTNHMSHSLPPTIVGSSLHHRRWPFALQVSPSTAWRRSTRPRVPSALAPSTRRPSIGTLSLSSTLNPSHASRCELNS